MAMVRMSANSRTFILLIVSAFALIQSIAYAASLSASPNPFTLSNTVIDIGQYATANTFISGGAGLSYSGEWVGLQANALNSQTVSTISEGYDPKLVAFNPSGTLAYVVNSNIISNVDAGSTVNVINTATGSVVATIPVACPGQLAVNPTNTLVYVEQSNFYCNFGPNVIVISTSSFTVVNVIGLSTSYPTGITFNPSNTLAYVASLTSPGEISVINLATNTVVNTILDGGVHPYTIAINPSNTLGYAVNLGSASVSVINLATNTVVNTIGVNSDPDFIAINPSNTLAYVSYFNSNPVSIINLATNTVVNTISVPSGSGPQLIQLNPSNTLAYVSNQGGQTLSAINLATNTVVNTISVQNSADLAINPVTGNVWLMGSTFTNTISVISGLPETPIYTPNSLQSGTGALQLSIDALTSNSLSLTFNGISKTFSLLPGYTLYGPWTLYGFAQDNGTNPYYYGSNVILLSNTLTVDPALVTPTISASNTLVDTGQYVNFAAYETGGTPPYTYNFIVYNSVTNIQVANMLTSSNSFLWQANGNAGNTLVSNVFVSDHASISVTMNSLHSSQIVAYSTPSVSLTVQTGSGIATNSILYGNSIITTAAVTGGSGTGNFIYAFTLNNAEVQNTVSSTTLSSTNTLNSNTIPGNYVFNVIVTDTGTTTHYSVPQVTNTVVVESNDLLSATSSGNPGFAGFYSAVNVTFTGTPTIGNQSAWSLYVNGALFGKTDSVMHWTEQGSPGTYSFTFTNPGNANYTSESLTSSLKVGSLGTGGSGVSSSSPPPTTQLTTAPTTTPSTVVTTVPPSTSLNQTVNLTHGASQQINFSNTGVTIELVSNSSSNSTAKLLAINVTALSPNALIGFTKLSATNITSNATVVNHINVKYSYPCNIPAANIRPFILENGTWDAISPFTVNATSCTVSFSMPADPVVAIMEQNQTAPKTPSNASAVSTLLPTTAAAQPTPSSTSSVLLIAVIIIIIIIIIAVLYMLKNKRPRLGS